MKKKSYPRIGGFFKRNFNFKQWSDWDRIFSGVKFLLQTIKAYCMPDQKKKNESFAVVQKRLKLSDQDLLTQQKALFRLSVWMLILAFCILLYTLFHIFQFHFKSFFISLMVFGLALIMSFRYHFWYFQIKHKKLGCSFREWYQLGIRGKRNE